MSAESWITIITSLTALVTALGGLATVLIKLGKIEIQIDGRLTQLLELTKKSSHAEGMVDQKRTET